MFNIVYNICKESVWSVVRQNNECEYQEDVVQDSGKTGTGVRAEKWALQEAQEQTVEVAYIRMSRWMCGVTKLEKYEKKE